MNEVKWGIIGCGDVCERKSAPAMYRSPHSRLVAVMRRDERKLRDFAARHGVEKTYTSAGELIADPQVDIVYVATPPAAHREYAIAAMEAGKPVYVEKPMALGYAECLEMTAAARRTGQKLFVAYYRRAMPYFLKVKELLDAGAIGRVTGAEVRYARPPGEQDKDPAQHPWRLDRATAGEGYFFDMASHTLDILDFLLGEITQAHGVCENRAGYYQVADTVCAAMRFASGVPATGSWHYAAAPGVERDEVRISGTDGEITFATFSFEPVRLTVAGSEQRFDLPPSEHIQQPLIESIVAELRGEGRCPSTGESAARTSRVMDWIVGKLP